MIIDRTTVYRLYENELRVLTGATPRQRLLKVETTVDKDGQFLRLDVSWADRTTGARIASVVRSKRW
jgi:hypothetical protein